MFSPLEQFEVFALIPMILPPELYNLDISLTNASLFLVLAFALYLLFMYVGLKKAAFIPTNNQIVLEEIYGFVVNLIKQQSGVRGLRYFPIFFSIFSLFYYRILLV